MSEKTLQTQTPPASRGHQPIEACHGNRRKAIKLGRANMTMIIWRDVASLPGLQVYR